MSLSDLASGYIRQSRIRDETERNVIEFAEAPWGLGLGASPEVPPLFPAQKFILKAIYNIPVDDKERNIIIRDRFNEKERFRFTEIEYLDFLYNEGRINIKEITGNPEDLRPNVVLVIGRRGTKTSTIAIVVSFETYKLLKKECPQQYYHIMPEQDIRITCVATSQDQAAELFRMITGHLERSDYFRKFRDKPTLNYMLLNTQRDLDQYEGKRPSIRIVAAPCSGRGLRGRNNIVAILDEIAYFFENETSVDRSDKIIYDAVTPSTAKFSSPEGEPHGRTICISSPAIRSGKFYEMYERSLEKDCDDLLMIKAPCWEVDYTLSPKMLRGKYAESPNSYDAEYGANFSDRVAAWIENEQYLRMNIIPSLKLKTMSYERTPHFMGIDIGLKNDGTAICVCHISKKGNNTDRDEIELDAIDVRYAVDEDKEFFRPEEMADWIYEYTKKFFIVKGIMDQYFGMAIVPLLNDKSIKQIEAVHMGREFNSRVYQNLMSKMLDAGLRIPEGEERLVQGKKTKDLELVTEMLSLQAIRHSKYLITVEAPDVKDGHDDMSDAFGRAVYLATDYLSSGGGISKHNVVMNNKSSKMSYMKYHRKSKKAAVYTNRPSSRIQTEAYMNRHLKGSFIASPGR